MQLNPHDETRFVICLALTMCLIGAVQRLRPSQTSPRYGYVIVFGGDSIRVKNGATVTHGTAISLVRTDQPHELVFDLILLPCGVSQPQLVPPSPDWPTNLAAIVTMDGDDRQVYVLELWNQTEPRLYRVDSLTSKRKEVPIKQIPLDEPKTPPSPSAPPPKLIHLTPPTRAAFSCVLKIFR